MNKSVLIENLEAGMTVVRNNGMTGEVINIYPIKIGKNEGRKIITNPIQVSFSASNGTLIRVE